MLPTGLQNVQFFEVTKLSRWQRGQLQVVIVEFLEDTGGRLRVLNSKGELRREVKGVDLLAVEKMSSSESKEGPMAVMKYLRPSTKADVTVVADHSQTYVFDSEELRDAFVGAIVRMNPRMNVQNRSRGVSQVLSRPGTLPGGRDASASIVPSVLAAADSHGVPELPHPTPDDIDSVSPSARTRAATVSSGSRAVNARMFGGAHSSAAVPAVRRAGGKRFFVMVENGYGFVEPRVVALSDAGGLVQLFDSHETIRDEFVLLQLRDVYLHAVDETVVMLSFAMGDGVSTTRTDVIVVFGTGNQRSDFVRALASTVSPPAPAVEESSGPMAAAVPAPPPPIPWAIHTAWADPLPLHKWFKFDVVKVNKTLKNQRYTVMVSPQLSQARFLRVTGGKELADDSIVHNDAPVEFTVGISAGEVVLERLPASRRRVRLSINQSSSGFGGRSPSLYEFRSVCDAERFMCVLARVGAVPEVMPRHLLSTPVASAPVLEPVLRATALWGTHWPTQPVNIFVGAWNVSSAPPPESLSGFLCKPVEPNVPASGEGVDLFVIGLQEIGTSANRDLWGAALFGYLNAGGNAPQEGPLALMSPPAPPAKYTGRREKDTGKLYSLVAFESMWELGIWAFIRTVHVNDITRVSSGYEATGVSLAKEITGKQFGNKGGVGVSFAWCGVPLCFINAHLAARPTRIKEREADYCQITDKLRLTPEFGDVGFDLMHQHEHVFWLGDLNYRTDIPYDRTLELVEEQNWPAILERDQLKGEMERGRVFTGFQSVPINFPPSYRWLREEVTFSNKNMQSPSYTDRIMYRSAPGVRSFLTVESSSTNNRQFGSDHRPVMALFSLQLRLKYTVPDVPKRHVICPLPTFFTDADRASGFKTPAIQLEGVSLIGLMTSSTPSQAYLECFSTLCESRVVSGVSDSFPDPRPRPAAVDGIPLATIAVEDPPAPASTAAAAGAPPAPTPAAAPVDGSRCKFDWRVMPSILPVVWDPRLLNSHHIWILARSGAPSGSGGFSTDDVFAQACVPLAPLCASVRTSIEMARRQAGAPPLEAPINQDSDDVSSADPSWLLDPADKTPLIFKQEGVPFTVPLLRRGQAIGIMEGRLKLISSEQAIIQGGSSLGSHWDFARGGGEREEEGSPASAMGTPVLSPSSSSPRVTVPTAAKAAGGGGGGGKAGASSSPTGSSSPAGSPAPAKKPVLKSRIRMSVLSEDDDMGGSSRSFGAATPLPASPAATGTAAAAGGPSSSPSHRSVEEERAQLLSRLPPHGSLLSRTPVPPSPTRNGPTAGNNSPANRVSVSRTPKPKRPTPGDT